MSKYIIYPYSFNRDNRIKYKSYSKQSCLDKKYKYDNKISFRDHIKQYYGLEGYEYLFMVSKGCLICGAKKYISLHHKIPKSKGGTNDKSNLIPLCYNCHTKQHNNRQWDT